MASSLSLDNVGGIFVVLLAGVGAACTIAVIEFVWKSRKLERKVKVNHVDLVKKAITKTNQNMFYINRGSGENKDTICTEHPLEEVKTLAMVLLCDLIKVSLP